MSRGTLRLCDWCFRSNTRCHDSRRRSYGWHRHDSWKNTRRHQWREKVKTNATPRPERPSFADALDRLRADIRASLAEYDASPGAKYDHPDCGCTWCTFVNAIREAVAE